MNKYTVVISVLILCCFVACNKSSDNGVFIRVKNNTTQEFKEIITNDKSFGHVAVSTLTAYQHFIQVSDLPFVILIDNNNDTAYAGTHYIDPPVAYLSKGNYTLEVFEDTSAYYGYGCSYISD